MSVKGVFYQFEVSLELLFVSSLRLSGANNVVIENCAPTVGILSLFASFLQGAAIPARCEQIGFLQPGSKIFQNLKSGDRMNCTYKDSDSIRLRVLAE